MRTLGRPNLLLLALILGLSPLSVLQAQDNAGGQQCANWIEMRDADGPWQSGLQWALGYLAGVSDGARFGIRESEPDGVLFGMEAYCLTNPQHTLLQAARNLRAAPGIRMAGAGNSQGLLADQSTMNEICRSSFPGLTEGAFPVRWATTLDYREYSLAHGWNNNMSEIRGTVALRADDTEMASDGRLLDKATGAISPQGSSRYPGAVLLEDKKAAFSGRSRSATPLCVWGPPNTALRCP